MLPSSSYLKKIKLNRVITFYGICSVKVLRDRIVRFAGWTGSDRICWWRFYRVQWVATFISISVRFSSSPWIHKPIVLFDFEQILLGFESNEFCSRFWFQYCCLIFMCSIYISHAIFSLLLDDFFFTKHEQCNIMQLIYSFLFLSIFIPIPIFIP